MTAQKAPSHADFSGCDSLPPLESGVAAGFSSSLLGDSWLSCIAKEVSRVGQMCESAVILSSLVVVSAALSRSHYVAVGDGLSMPVNLWGCVSLGSGNRKSAVHNILTSPLAEFATDSLLLREGKDYQNDIIRAESIAGQIKKLKQKPPCDENTANISALIDDLNSANYHLENKYRGLEYFIDDATPEATRDFLKVNEGYSFISSSEGNHLLSCAKLSSDNPSSLSLYLKGYDAERFNALRVSSGKSNIGMPIISKLIFAQPDILRAIDDGCSGGLYSNGFFARFLFSYPADLVGSRNIAAAFVDADILEFYKINLKAIAGWQPSLTKPDSAASFPSDLRCISLSDDAYFEWERFASRVESSLSKHSSSQLKSDVAFASKLANKAARVAAIIHSVDAVGCGVMPADSPVSADSMARAVDLCAFFTPHTLAVNSIIKGGKGAVSSILILDWLLKKQCRCDNGSSVRVVYSGLRKSISSMELLQSSLIDLEQHGYISICITPSKTHKNPFSGSSIVKLSDVAADYLASKGVYQWID